jgi:hypothetical protein
MKRLVLHWTGGGPRPSPYELDHYHFLIAQDGERHEGNKRPEANRSPLRDGYVAHAGGFNSDAIGVAVCGMHGATESPFKAGPWPITGQQMREAAKLAAELCDTYRIKVTPETVLMHSEIRPRFGRGVYKWDVNVWGGLTKPLPPFEAGNAFRDMVQRELDEMTRVTPVVTAPVSIFTKLVAAIQRLFTGGRT